MLKTNGDGKTRFDRAGSINFIVQLVVIIGAIMVSYFATIGTIKSDICVIKTNVIGICKDIETVQADCKELTKDVHGLDVRVTVLEGK